MVQNSHPYMSIGKTLTLTRRTFVGKVMSLLFNMLARLVIAFLPRSKHLLITWLQSPSAGILEPKKIKSVTVSSVSPSICHEVMGPSLVRKYKITSGKIQSPQVKLKGTMSKENDIKINSFSIHLRAQGERP